MDIVQLRALIERVNEAGKSKADEEGMVYQVWEDGEITLQKSGSLLWQRSLHCLSPGLPSSIEAEHFPSENLKSAHAYAFCPSLEDAKEVRRAIGQVLASQILFMSGNFDEVKS